MVQLSEIRRACGMCLCLLAACSGARRAQPAGQSAAGSSQPASTAQPAAGGAQARTAGGSAAPSSVAGSSAAAGRGAAAGSGVQPSAAGASAGGAGASAPAVTAGSAAAGQTASAPAGKGFYQLERLGRGLVAIQAGGGVFVSWRMLGPEYDAEHPERVSYELQKDGAKLAEVKAGTNYQDAAGTPTSRYAVRALLDGVPGEWSPELTAWSQSYLRIPLSPPSGNYTANDASAADLDGDGEYEIILKWDPNDSKDNSQSGVTSPVFLDGLKLDGKRLWRIDLGPNIRAGAHYTQFIVFDFDGDGQAELGVKTAPGTKGGDGHFLTLGPAANDDDSAVYRNSDGYVLSGPEYLSIFGGRDGKELATVPYDVPRGQVSAWGDDYGNRVDRFLATAAYLDDSGLPSLVMARGYYTRTTLTAWNFRNGKLAQLWKFDSNVTPKDAKGHAYTGQGAHSLSVANVDDDPQQEIIYGSMTVDNDGKGKCSVGYNHGDALHVSDFVPSHPGLEVFMPNEDGKHPAYYVRAADSCEVLFEGPVDGNDTGRAVAADVLADHPGAEVWAAGNTGLLDAASGKKLGDAPGSINFLVFWDGDESRELLDKTSIAKYGGGTLLECRECASNNTTKATPALVADLLGDWREEVLWREADNTALRLYSTTAPSERRIYTLMHDAQYRVAISWQNVAYNQPPHPSFAIGHGMANPPAPDMRTR